MQSLTPPSTPHGPRRRTELTKQEAMRRLAGVKLGRVVFTSQAMPAIRPVNHLIEGGHIILRTSEDSAITTAAATPAGTVVAYEADDIDSISGTGWSVIVTGLARILTDPAAARYQAALQAWDPGEKDQIISIDPGLITGIELATSDHTPGLDPG